MTRVARWVAVTLAAASCGGDGSTTIFPSSSALEDTHDVSDAAALPGGDASLADGPDPCAGVLCDGVQVGPCAIAVCDPTTGACAGEPVVDGTPCDDGNPCSDGETCLTGACGGATLVPDGSPCEDGDPCTNAEACGEGLCLSGTPEPDCLCGDRPEGAACDDLDPCTAGDACLAGTCAGVAVDCSAQDGPCGLGVCDSTLGGCASVAHEDGAACDDESLCTADDACAAGACVGTPVDCTGLDGPCTVGVCEAATGACAVTLRLDGTPCGDGDPCTTADACDGGLCGGSGDLCGPCVDLAAGDPCDDGDPCTPGESACADEGGVLVCAGEALDCSHLDGGCEVGACDPSGACVIAARPDGTACDDGVPCTAPDACAAGVCVGAVVEACGESHDLCEGSAANDTIGSAEALELGSDGGTTLVGWLDPAGETDWYAVAAEAGLLLTVETRSHCGSALDTQLAVYAPDGATALGSADGGAGWATLEALPVAESGLHFVGVTALTASGAGSYVLEVAAALPPLCESDADCGCDQLTCVLEGPRAGQCSAGLGDEVEPNGGPTVASPIAVDAPALGAFSVPGDVDWWSISLQAAVPVDLLTAAFCEDSTDPALAVFDEAGEALLASDADSGGGGQARITSYFAPSDGIYRILVQDEVLSVGSYVLTVADARCESHADCDCADLQCSGTPLAPGLCAPLLTADGGATPFPIEVGERVHGSIEAPHEADLFVVELPAGTYDLETLSFCGSDTDTELTITGPGGETVAADADSGAAFFAAVAGLEVPAAGAYELEVRAYGAGVGEYLLRVEPSGGLP